MTNPTLTCEQFADALADFLERDSAEPMRAAMETHALSCHDCGPLLADLRKLRLDAANLPELAPSRDLWAGIAERIETPVVVLRGTGNAERGARKARLWLGLAAAGLVAVTATVTYQVARRNVVTPVQVTANASAPIATLTSPAKTDSVAVSPRSPLAAPRSSQTTLVSNTKPTADQTFDNEISRLRKIVDARKTQLDTATVSVIEKNLKIIDDAIAQCRAALVKDPHSQYLSESLNEALDNKVQLLRTAATLPVRM
jgi:hypothetical protein